MANLLVPSEKHLALDHPTLRAAKQDEIIDREEVQIRRLVPFMRKQPGAGRASADQM